MNGRISKLIHDYAATYREFGEKSEPAMESIAKNRYSLADRKERRRIVQMMKQRILKFTLQRQGHATPTA